MEWVKKNILRIKTPQWILIAAALANGAAAAAVGIADNIPGIIMLYITMACIASAWVWNWRSPRDFWILLGLAVAAFPISVVLHNLLFGLAALVKDIPVLVGILGFLEALFFIVAVIAAGPAALVALIGGIYTSWRGIEKLTLVNRSIRRFKEKTPIKASTMLRLINHVRQSASSANLQPLKFILSITEEQNSLIFPTLSWAGYLPDWDGPEPGERPAGYIVVLGDTEIAKSYQYDAGIASQSITLGAAELGLGACLIGSIKKDSLRTALSIPTRYEILLVIALGKPAESVVLDEVGEEGEIKYWRDQGDVHHVPKRGVDELILDL